ncbi:MAG: hypothetical protein ACK5GN_10750 [Pseudomonadota bacterium]|jgi:hypothetical protein
MLLTEAEQLKEIIVVLLAGNPNLSATQIENRLAAGSRPFSRRAIFKELKILEQLGVLVNTNGHYALQLIWLINTTSLLRSAYLSYINTASNLGIIPLAERTRFTFYDLSRLDYVWMQIIFVLQQVYPQSLIRIWKPEQWFHLVHIQIMDNFFSALGKLGAKQRHLIGHDCFTCRYGARLIPRRVGQVRFSSDTSQLGLNTYITLIGDHVITIRLNAEFARRMHVLFASIRNREEMFAPNVLDSLRGRVESSLLVEYRPKALRALSNRFDMTFDRASGTDC